MNGWTQIFGFAFIRNFENKMFKLSVMMILLILCSLLLQSCGSFRIETYLISTKIKPQWVSIEYGNPKCEPLKGSELSIEFVIPENGFICTSSPEFKGMFQRSYFLVDENGNRTQLKAKEQIWQEAVLSRNEPSLDKDQPNCNVKVNQFFYGSGDDLRKIGNNPIFQDENFLTNFHPECRNTGVSVPKKNPT